MSKKELQKKINAIIEEEVTAKLDDIQEYIDSGDLDKEIADGHRADEESEEETEE